VLVERANPYEEVRGLAQSLRVLGLLLTALLLAGCAGSSKAGPAASEPTAIALGSVEGRLIDEAQLPVPDVRVQLVEAGMNATSREDGSFRFDAVVVGSHTLLVESAGYRTIRQKVEVRLDETTKADLVLAAIATVTPYVEVLPFEGYIQQGNQYLDVVTTTLGVNGCEKCRFYFNASGDVDSLVSEILFTRTIDNPHGPEVLAYGLFTQDMNKRFTPDGQYWPSRGKFQIDRRWTEAGERLLHTHACDDLWVCVDQTFTNYVSLFHNQAAPEGYSALPK
jgi:hypothetical protein